MTIEQAVAAEREACAQAALCRACLRCAHENCAARRHAAERIRSRGPTIDLSGAVRAFFEVLDAHHAGVLDYAVVIEHEQRLRSIVQPGVGGGQEA